MEKSKKQKLGKSSRAKGKLFEKKVEADLEKDGWTVIKFNKQVDLAANKLVTARAQYNPFFKRIVGEGSGYPDFVCLRYLYHGNIYEVIGVESKVSGKLDKIEKQKCNWLLKNNIFSRILIASKSEKRGQIKYEEYKYT